MYLYVYFDWFLMMMVLCGLESGCCYACCHARKLTVLQHLRLQVAVYQHTCVLHVSAGTAPVRARNVMLLH
jgi:hypothetical protein